MSELTLRLTVPVLEELAKRHEPFIVQLAHSAALEFSKRYGRVLTESDAMKGIIDRLNERMAAVNQEVSKILTEKIGSWSSYNNFTLRKEVVEHINREYREILVQHFNDWVNAPGQLEMLENLIVRHVDARVDKAIDKRITEILNSRLAELLKPSSG